ncbi:hypothetical protein AXF42_Ash001861 [Apostasia shenzhenica]|uniref:Uncharacterized protein n=1 Tax=Apostasia shenzhenica TaxID=1088818 RepID=A0A2I0ABF4_9ASPA|nr:hypothetical protein AXF42_Ash001861 [Apostasia shenzhenica]
MRSGNTVEVVGTTLERCGNEEKGMRQRESQLERSVVALLEIEIKQNNTKKRYAWNSGMLESRAREMGWHDAGAHRKIVEEESRRGTHKRR